MKYVCRNPECSECGKEEYLSSERFFMRNGNYVGENAPCPVCGQIREEINPNTQISPAEKNISLMKFQMASSEGKREILKRRSHEHYEKEVRPVKEEKMRKAVESFQEASKK